LNANSAIESARRRSGSVVPIVHEAAGWAARSEGLRQKSRRRDCWSVRWGKQGENRDADRNASRWAGSRDGAQDRYWVAAVHGIVQGFPGDLL